MALVANRHPAPTADDEVDLLGPGMNVPADVTARGHRHVLEALEIAVHHVPVGEALPEKRALAAVSSCHLNGRILRSDQDDSRNDFTPRRGHAFDCSGD